MYAFVIMVFLMVDIFIYEMYKQYGGKRKKKAVVSNLSSSISLIISQCEFWYTIIIIIIVTIIIIIIIIIIMSLFIVDGIINCTTINFQYGPKSLIHFCKIKLFVNMKHALYVYTFLQKSYMFWNLCRIAQTHLK